MVGTEDNRKFILLFNIKTDSISSFHQLKIDPNLEISLTTFGNTFCRWKERDFKVIGTITESHEPVQTTSFLLATHNRGRLVFTGFKIEEKAGEPSFSVEFNWYTVGFKNLIEWHLESFSSKRFQEVSLTNSASHKSAKKFSLAF